MVSALISGSGSQGSSPGQGHLVIMLWLIRLPDEPLGLYANTAIALH